MKKLIKALPKLLIFMILSLLLISLVRCDKKEDVDPDSAICQLNSITINYSEKYGNETESYTETIYFSYDINGRISEIRIADMEYNEKFVITYSPNDKIEKIQLYYNNFSAFYILFTWVENTATLQMHWEYEGEIYSYDDKTVIYFNTNDEITRVEYFYYNSDEETWFVFWYDLYTWSNGNITKIEEYYQDYWDKGEVIKNYNKVKTDLFKIFSKKEPFNQLAPRKKETSDFTKVQTITYTYDSKKNPFANNRSLGLIALENTFLNNNNPLRETVTIHYDGSQITNSYTYKYNKYNYPTERSFTETTPYWSSTEKWTYSYSCN